MEDNHESHDPLTEQESGLLMNFFDQLASIILNTRHQILKIKYLTLNTKYFRNTMSVNGKI